MLAYQFLFGKVKIQFKHQEAHLIFNELNDNEHKNEHHFEILELYEEYQTLKKSLEKYQQLLFTINTVKLLDKALELGEISPSQYYMEESYFYDSYDDYLQMEKDYHLVIAELYKYEL